MNKISNVGIGHNSQELVSVEMLGLEHSDIIARRDELLEDFKNAPSSVQDADDDKAMTDSVNQFLALKKTAETTHKSVKEPYLRAGRVVDGFFKGVAEKMDECSRELRRRQTEYKLKLEAEERRKREETARAQAEAARKAEEEAKAKMEEIDFDDPNTILKATQAQNLANSMAVHARETQDATKVKAAELTRARGDFGSVSSLRSEWKGELLNRADLDLESLRHHITEDAYNQAIRSYIKANAPKGKDDSNEFPAPLKGARIWLHKFTR